MNKPSSGHCHSDPCDSDGSINKPEDRTGTSKDLDKNRFSKNASSVWKRPGIEDSPCLCRGNNCDNSCWNRAMNYECNVKNCNIGLNCGNRPFAELKANISTLGVRVVKTRDRGQGIQATRSFAPGELIIEYCGEIITREESIHRMEKDYKDETDHYLMAFEQGLIIDGTHGSICRFVNHSCDPNCVIEKLVVNGELRMGLFAGRNGISTNSELTFDYDFEIYNPKNTQTCRCGAENCRGIISPKSLAPVKQRTTDTMGAAAGVQEIANNPPFNYPIPKPEKTSSLIALESALSLPSSVNSKAYRPPHTQDTRDSSPTDNYKKRSIAICGIPWIPWGHLPEQRFVAPRIELGSYTRRDPYDPEECCAILYLNLRKLSSTNFLAQYHETFPPKQPRRYKTEFGIFPSIYPRRNIGMLTGKLRLIRAKAKLPPRSITGLMPEIRETEEQALLKESQALLKMTEKLSSSFLKKLQELGGLKSAS